MVVVYFITAVTAMVIMQIKWYLALGMMVVLTLLGFGSQCITTKFDLKNPKFGWSNFQQSLKNSKHSWISMLVGLIAMIIVGAIAVPFILDYIVTESTNNLVIMWILLVVASALYAFVSYKILVNNSQKLFNSIEA